MILQYYHFTQSNHSPLTSTSPTYICCNAPGLCNDAAVRIRYGWGWEDNLHPCLNPYYCCGLPPVVRSCRHGLLSHDPGRRCGMAISLRAVLYVTPASALLNVPPSLSSLGATTSAAVTLLLPCVKTRLIPCLAVPNKAYATRPNFSSWGACNLEQFWTHYPLDYNWIQIYLPLGIMGHRWPSQQ